mgnify:CR=1 FL=1
MRTLIVHNPKSGFGSDAIYQFQRAIIREGDECVFRLLPAGVDAAEAVEDAEGFDVVVVSGGDGTASVKLPKKDEKLVTQAALRTASRTDVDPTTGAELGAADPELVGKDTGKRGR